MLDAPPPAAAPHAPPPGGRGAAQAGRSPWGDRSGPASPPQRTRPGGGAGRAGAAPEPDAAAGERLPAELLERLLSPLEARFGASRVGLWLGDGGSLRLGSNGGGGGGVLTLRAPHRFAADRLEQSGLAAALDAAAAEAGLPGDADGKHLRVEVAGERPPAPPAAPAAPAPPANAPGDEPPARGATPAAAAPNGRPRNAPAAGGTHRSIEPRHRLEDFLPSRCNELAHAASAALAAGDQPGPLFLHGACGLGKTHLLTGIVAAWRDRRPGERVVQTTGERFTNRFIDHARHGTLDAFRREVRGCALLAIDDVHFIAGKQKTQHELLHCFEAALSAGVPVVFASDRHPRELAAMGAALASRCLQGLVAELTPPDAEEKRRFLVELGRRRGLALGEAAAAELAELAGGSVREIEGLLAKLDVLERLRGPGLTGNPFGGGGDAWAGGAGGAGGRAVGAGLIERLRRLEKPAPAAVRLAPGPAGVKAIAEAVGESLGVAASDAVGGGRSKPVVQARSLVAHLARELTTMSFPEIARAMGRPSHSSVITADKRLRAQLAADEAVFATGSTEPVPLRRLVEDLRGRLTPA